MKTMKDNYRLFDPVDDLNDNLKDRNLIAAQIKPFILDFVKVNKQDVREVVSADLPVFLANFLHDQVIAPATEMSEFLNFEDVREEFSHVVDM